MRNDYLINAVFCNFSQNNKKGFKVVIRNQYQSNTVFVSILYNVVYVFGYLDLSSAYAFDEVVGSHTILLT